MSRIPSNSTRRKCAFSHPGLLCPGTIILWKVWEAAGQVGTWVLSEQLKPWWAELVPKSETGSRSLNSRKKPSSGNLTHLGKSETYFLVAGEAEENKMQHLGRKLVHALAALWTVFYFTIKPHGKRILQLVKCNSKISKKKTSSMSQINKCLKIHIWTLAALSCLEILDLNLLTEQTSLGPLGRPSWAGRMCISWRSHVTPAHTWCLSQEGLKYVEVTE